MSEPLLTQVLADAHHGSRSMRHRLAFVDPTKSHDPRCHDAGIALAAAIPPAIADRLERALGACAFTVDDVTCDAHLESWEHEHVECYPDDNHEPYDACHPYQPLIRPTGHASDGEVG